MVASRWPQRLPLVAAMSFSTSATVRYSRVRRSPLRRRLGVGRASAEMMREERAALGGAVAKLSVTKS
jgi:hypothetical protein